mgnify:CR=1 FL=1|tara:strand:- start:2976 stop:3269 length:294 start_codon:yes stop_codon:yes gene_type:complete
MRIRLMGFQLFEAISLYTKAKYGAELEVDLESPCMVDINDWQPKYLKDDNDKHGYLRDEKGCAIPDPKKKQYKNYRLHFGECDELYFFVEEIAEEEK